MSSMAEAIKGERWRIIAKFPEYAVSNMGRVRRVVADKKNHGCRILKHWLNNKGYPMIGLSKSGVVYRKLISRLVCEAFRGPRPTRKHEVAHNDGRPSNNRVPNLRWATRSENMADCIKHGTKVNGARHFTATNPEKIARGERHGMAVLTAAKVRQIRAAKKVIGSGVALAKRYGVTPATICVIRSRKIWRHV